MKLRLRIISGIIIAFALFYSAVYAFVSFKAGDIVKKELEKLTGKKVTIGYFLVSMPLDVEIKNLNIEGMAKVDNVYIYPSLMHFLIGRLAFNTVKFVRPEFTFEKKAAQGATQASTPAKNLKEQPSPRKRNNSRLMIKRIKVIGGKVNFIDHTAGKEGIIIYATDINFNLKNLFNIFTFSSITTFDLTGKIPWQKGKEEGKITADGWLNLIKNDMQATLKITDIDGVYLYPYYSQWVDLEKARIESAKLNFTSDINALNNNLSAQCHLELTDIVRSPRPPDQPEQKAERITNVILGVFKELDEGKVVLDFTLKTKMDKPQLGFGEIKTAVENKIAKVREASGIKPEGIFLLPIKLMEGLIKGAADISKAAIDGTFAVGGELTNAITSSFKKEIKPEPKQEIKQVPKEEIKKAPKETPKEAPKEIPTETKK